MGFYRLNLTKDNFITNISTDGTNGNRATGSNEGSNPTLQIFALKNRLFTGSIELARTLLQFDIVDLSRSIFIDKTIPSSSVTYTLKCPNFTHGQTIPTSYNLYVYPISQSWTEGSGSDSSRWRDYGWCNWLSSSSTQAWTNSGSDYLATGYGSGSQLFDRGMEDLEVDLTPVVNNWLTSSIGQAGGLPNSGLLIKLGNAEETNQTDYFVKMFHSRESRTIDRIPYLQAEWSTDVLRDNRGNAFYNQWNRFYFYNFIRGQLTGAQEPVFVQIKDHTQTVSSSWNTFLTASRVDTGIYSASIYVNNFTASFSSSWTDIWFSGTVSGSTHTTGSCYMSGGFTQTFLSGNQSDPYEQFIVDVNLNQEYRTNEKARIRVNVRKKNFKASHLRTVHTGSLSQDREYIEEMYYSILDYNNQVIVPFLTGSQATRLSYDKSGNYFDIFMNGFIQGFTYRFLFMIYNNKSKIIMDENFLFKVI